MATDYYYGVNLGKGIDGVSTGTSTTSSDVEVHVNLTNVASREDVLLAIEKLEAAITSNPWPPA